MTDLVATLSTLFVHPVKSCGAMSPRECELVETGLDLDRAWMVVDRDGEMLTQRELPRLALVQPTHRGNEIVLRAPGMLALHLRVDTVEEATRARVWDDEVRAYDMGDLAAQWFSDFLGQTVRLARFDPEQRRLSERRWTGTIEAENAFSDGFPLLVASTASLADLNARLAARGQPAVTMERFRPNLVIDGWQPWDEDHLESLRIDTPEGPVVLQLVKPCVRCSIPNVDPLSAQTSSEPGATLAGFRSDPSMGGGVTFGINAVVAEGLGRTLAVGQSVQARWRL